MKEGDPWVERPQASWKTCCKWGVLITLLQSNIIFFKNGGFWTDLFLRHHDLKLIWGDLEPVCVGNISTMKALSSCSMTKWSLYRLLHQVPWFLRVIIIQDERKSSTWSASFRSSYFQDNLSVELVTRFNFTWTKPFQVESRKKFRSCTQALQWLFVCPFYYHKFIY